MLNNSLMEFKNWFLNMIKKSSILFYRIHWNGLTSNRSYYGMEVTMLFNEINYLVECEINYMI